MINPVLCNFGGPTFLIFSSNVPSLIYYTHVTALVLSLIIGLSVYLKDRKSLVNKILLGSLIPFLLWVFFNIIIWASNRSDVIMFLWSLQIMIEPLTYIGMFYLVYVFINKRDVSLKTKIAAGLIYMPLIIITPTSYNLSAFDISLCIPVENFYAYYTYFLEALSIIAIASFSVRKYAQSQSIDEKRQIAYLSLGVILFLLTFASGNIFGSLTDDWVTSQFGLFGTPIFAGFIAYLVVKYKIFNIKFIATQALVLGLWISLLSVLFIRNIENVRIIVSLTLILFLITGIALVRSVKKEVAQREKIEKLAKDLESANKELQELDEMKSEFLSLATHQIRSPLTAIKGYTSMILEGDFGEIPFKAREAVGIVMKSSTNLINIVAEFLDISRIEKGRMVYNSEKFNIRDLVKEVVSELKPNIDKAGLAIEVNMSEKMSSSMVTADKGKIKQIVGNLIDNAIKYSIKGNINVNIEEELNMIKVSVKDTGIGIPAEEIGRLFSKFYRTKDAHKTNVTGTGLGLYIGKKMIEAQRGTIKAFSEGEGKGSTFTIELPRAK